MNKKTIKVSEFSQTPFGRYPADGKYNGQSFREEYLLPNLMKYDVVKVKFGGILCSTTFLHESFAGLVRRGYLTSAELLKKLIISHDLNSYESEIKHLILISPFGIDRDTPLKE